MISVVATPLKEMPKPQIADNTERHSETGPEFDEAYRESGQARDAEANQSRDASFENANDKADATDDADLGVSSNPEEPEEDGDQELIFSAPKVHSSTTENVLPSSVTVLEKQEPVLVDHREGVAVQADMTSSVPSDAEGDLVMPPFAQAPTATSGRDTVVKAEVTTGVAQNSQALLVTKAIQPIEAELQQTPVTDRPSKTSVENLVSTVHAQGVLDGAKQTNVSEGAKLTQPTAQVSQQMFAQQEQNAVRDKFLSLRSEDVGTLPTESEELLPIEPKSVAPDNRGVVLSAAQVAVSMRAGQEGDVSLLSADRAVMSEGEKSETLVRSSEPIIAPATQASGQLTPARIDVGQVIAQFSASVQRNGAGQFEIALNPPELGRLRITLESLDSGMVISINADKSETMDLLRRHIDQLEREMRDLGYESVSFKFASDSDSQGSQWNDEASGRGNPDSQQERATELENAQSPTDVGRALGRIDIRI